MRPGLSEEDFASFETQYEVRFPEALKELLRYSNGGHPERDSYPAEDPELDESFAVNRFHYLLPGDEGVCSIAYAIKEWRPILGDKALPFASDGGGNEFFLDLEDSPPTVKICLHDEDMAVVDLAPSFEAFIDALYLDPDME